MINKDILNNSTVKKINIKGRAILNLHDCVNIRVTQADGTVTAIPAVEANTDYQTYLEWIEDGNSLDGEETEVSDADE